MRVFALNKNNETVHVDSVPNGKDCQCVCKDCGQPLIACQGKIRLHHFRHADEQAEKKCSYKNSDENSKESQLHYHAKEIIFSEKRVMTCSVNYKNPNNGISYQLKGAELLLFKKVEKEKRLEIDGRERIVDLFCVTEDDEEICIEIRKTNRVQGDKFFNIQNSKKYIFLEIDVFNQTLENELDKVKLKEFLINSSSDRRWVFHPLIEKRKLEEERKRLEEKQRLQETRRKWAEEMKRQQTERQLEEIERRQEEKKKQEEKKRLEEIEKEQENKKKQEEERKGLEEKQRLQEETRKKKWLEETKRQQTERQQVEKKKQDETPAIPVSQLLSRDLNENQREAVEYCDGPQLVIAGAGSGKTRVLTYKIAYLLERGLMPWNILALTFTNKAANEMKQRIGQLVGQDRAARLQMGTFHSVFARILRVEAGQIGFNSNFTIYDEADSRSLLKSIISDLGLNDKIYKPASVHHFISMAKNNMVSLTEYIKGYREDLVSMTPEFERIFRIYEERCRLANAMDFDDLLCKMYFLLTNNEEIRHKYGNRFEYILIDEYQDTNILQKKTIQLLAKEHNKICAVGDDAQSIYSFRGANIDNILKFDEDFEGAVTFLVLNYRSTKNIVGAANSLIKHNKEQITEKPDIKADKNEDETGNEKLILKQAYSDKEEASIVCNDIRRIRRLDNCQYHDFAILYRTNAQSRPFEEEMRRQGIPYRIYGGLSFYQRKEIKDIIAYFRLVANPSDEEAFKRIINYPARGIGNTTVQKIAEAAQKNGVSYWDVITDPEAYKLAVNGGTLKKIGDFSTMMSGFISRMATTNAYELGREIIQTSGVSADLFSGNDPEQVSRQQNLEEFMNGLRDFVESRREEGREREAFLTDFLQEVSLLTDLDSDDGSESRVLLMTIHAAKGLEFPTVFIVGLEENIFPSPMASTTLRGLEEERRLLYVAITRAEKHCILTWAKSRWRYGKMEFGQPSRFLKDIDRSFMTIEGDSGFSGGGFGREMQNSRPVASQFMADKQPKITFPRRQERPVEPFSEGFKRQLAAAGGKFRKIGPVAAPPTAEKPSDAPLKEGNVIEHQRFGIGTVVKVEGSGENTKATVDFRNVGTKQLLLKFARYTIVR